MTTPVVCAFCGTGLRARAKFCDECGARLSTEPDAAQYKQVTVLFADVVRSMDIASVLDLERLREIMTDLLERAAAVVGRYGGTVEQTGDGVMATFGAPLALEDHAIRACLAANEIQRQTGLLANEVKECDGVDLRVRIGLNSGLVIAGDIGSGTLGYSATGEAVGMAQRMESAAPPGGVMMSESTAALVERAVVLGPPEAVRVKGIDRPVPARRLLAVNAPARPLHRDEAGLVGRDREMAVLDAMVRRAAAGGGGVLTVTGPPGVGKSRVAREAAALAGGCDMEVLWAFCESHARDMPFWAVSRLLRLSLGVDEDDGVARDQLRAQLPDADPQDLLLLDDLLGIADPAVTLPPVDPDARRRRLTALISTMASTRTAPALFVVEDTQWIDTASESMMAGLLASFTRTAPVLLLVTARPEYVGALITVPGAESMTLAPLSDADAAALTTELIGRDRSVADLAAVITARAAGNPFFAEEMVRELVQRGVLVGDPGRYRCQVDVAELSVPATVQAAIEARIDRLSAPARRTLTAASVIGVRFGRRLLTALEGEPAVDELLGTELIDQVSATPDVDYAFRHPLIRAVAYESQLKSHRSRWHRRLAAAIEECEPGRVEENAALIADHLRAAGEPAAAYGWYMRAAAWATGRDIAAARESWERAARIADELPGSTPDRSAMRIAPRTMLCATDWQARGVSRSAGRFDELRALCDAAGDKVSLAIGMTGLATELLYSGRAGEGARLASEQMALLESIGNPDLTSGLAFVGFANWFNSGEFAELLRWSQTVLDLTAENPSAGAGFGLGSPRAIALAFRGVARSWLGLPSWRPDIQDAVAMARRSDPITLAVVVAWTYALAVASGVLLADDAAMAAIEETVQIARRSSNDFALAGATFSQAVALLSRESDDDRRRGLHLMRDVRDNFLPARAPSLVPNAELWYAREVARRGELDLALPVMRTAVSELYEAGRLGWAILGTGQLVEVLLMRGTGDDPAEAHRLIEQLAGLRADHGSAMRDITLLRLRALLARTRGDTSAWADLASRYRATARTLGFEGHIAWAETM
ncbi:cyclase [Mycobacterium sp. Soil538]|nr:cyclase [Mycobacterium sp. Soil538]